SAVVTTDASLAIDNKQGHRSNPLLPSRLFLPDASKSKLTHNTWNREAWNQCRHGSSSSHKPRFGTWGESRIV
ncbi:hypothetical protein LINPERPRIM_LOCUS29697, partial [Linum perenne]